MKRESLGWFVAGAVIVLTCTLGAMQQQGGQVGRYQLLEGSYQMTTPKNTFDCTTVWRIDTVNGDTVRFAWGSDDTGRFIGWVKVEDVAPLEDGPPR